MRIVLVLGVLVTAACAGRDTPTDAWVFGHAGRQQGDRTMWSAVQDDFENNPTGSAYTAGNLIGAIVRRVLLAPLP